MKISFHSCVKKNLLSSQKLRFKTRFDEEADINLEMAHYQTLIFFKAGFMAITYGNKKCRHIVEK